MSGNIENNSEDFYTDIDFDEDENELKDSKFIGIEPDNIKIENNKDEKTSKFFNKEEKLLAEKIIEKKSGKIIEIKYNILGNKTSVTERDKEKKIKKLVEYYENGIQKLVVDYGKNGAYKSMAYNPDGSRASYVDKNEDGFAEAIYFDVDKEGSKLIVKLGPNKEVLEKRVEK